MRNNTKFRDVAHFYLGAHVVILSTKESVRMSMLGVNDPYPAYCGTEWYRWADIKPLLYHPDNKPVGAQNEIDALDTNDEAYWSKLALIYSRHHIDMFGLIEAGEAFEIQTTQI